MTVLPYSCIPTAAGQGSQPAKALPGEVASAGHRRAQPQRGAGAAGAHVAGAAGARVAGAAMTPTREELTWLPNGHGGTERKDGGVGEHDLAVDNVWFSEILIF